MGIDLSSHVIYCFWAGSPTADHLYYKKCSESVWDVDPTDWLDESTDDFTGYERISCYKKAWSGYLAVGYMTKTGSPYNVQFKALAMSASWEIDDSGAGVDVPSLEGQPSATDSGEGAESLALEGQINVDDMGGLETEEWIPPTGQEIPVGDWGCLSSELVKIEKETDEFWLYLEDFGAFKVRMGDEGSGIENWPYLGGIIEEFGYGTDQVNIVVAKTVSDLGVGVDEVKYGILGEVITIEAAIPATESGEGLETQVEMIGHCAFGDQGVGVELPSNMNLLDVVQDSGEGSDILDITSEQMKDFFDSGIGIDVVIELQRAWKDEGLGIDFLTEFSRSFAESGIGTEIIVDLKRAFLEIGVGTEVFSATKPTQVLDAGIGVDIPNIEAQSTISDSGEGTETPSLESQLPISEIGQGVEQITELDRAFPESGIGVDSLAKFERTLQESGLGIDTATKALKTFGAVGTFEDKSASASFEDQIITATFEEKSITGTFEEI